MTNPDNVGGLPLLQFAVFDEFGKGADDRVWDYGRRCFDAGRELCRAAPAGSGEVEDENIANIESYAGVLERMARCNPRTADDFNLSQSARHIRDYAALLRKLQQGAE